VFIPEGHKNPIKTAIDRTFYYR